MLTLPLLLISDQRLSHALRFFVKSLINQDTCTQAPRTDVLPPREVWPCTWSSSPSAPMSHLQDTSYKHYLHRERGRGEQEAVIKR